MTIDYGVCPRCGADLTENDSVLVEATDIVELAGRWNYERRLLEVEVSDRYEDGRPAVRCRSCKRPLRSPAYQRMDDIAGGYHSWGI